MNPLDKLESALGNLFRKLPTGSEPMEPVEVRRAILRDVEGRIEHRSGGECVFPYAEIVIQVPSGQEAALQGLSSEIRSHLSERGCTSEPVAVRIEPASGTEPFQVQYLTSSSRPELPRPAARLVVLAGQADETEVAILKDRTYLGRLKEVKQKAGGVERRNDVAFAPNEATVSRKHAWIDYVPKEGKFRAYKDPESSQGTRVFREGRAIPCDSTRGVQLRSGDEIHLGDARVRFELE